jgi:hypothetical protein
MDRIGPVSVSAALRIEPWLSLPRVALRPEQTHWLTPTRGGIARRNDLSGNLAWTDPSPDSETVDTGSAGHFPNPGLLP